MVAELLRCAYWFNPLVWVAARRLRQESEFACDDVVLALGVTPSAYATELVSVARQFTRSRNSYSPALAIAGPSGLERRIRAMLNHERNRRPLTPVLRIAAALGFAAVTLPIAALQTVAAQTFNTLSGFVVDPSDAVLPNTTMTLINAETKAKYEVKSDRSGRFEFVGLPQGDYSLLAELAGFARLQGVLTIAGQDAQRNLKLQVGSLEETVTVLGDPNGPRDPAPAPARVPLKGRGVPPCGAGPTTPAGAPVGGNIRPPHKLFDVRPVYPRHLMDARVTGVVVLDTRIGPDGHVTQARAVNESHPDLEAAAIDAVRQWVFDETLLNCVPIEVVMTATVRFTLKQ
jgi:TonB family protein